MSQLSAIQKQIAALQAKAERITKQEMSAAIAKVKSIMSEFGLTIEHLTHSGVGKRVAKKMKGAKTASVAKYVDPKTGKTWSGFGRAPAWIASAKNRDEFLIGAKATKPAAKKASTKVAVPAKKRAKATRTTKSATKKVAAPKAASKKRSATKATASKTAAQAKGVAKKGVSRKPPASVIASAPAEASPTA